MKLLKKEHIIKTSFMTPTPILISPDIIRVYGAKRDDKGIARIFYVDLSASNPSSILYESVSPSLDIGTPGMFDDNGVILGDVIQYKNEYYMYYVGFQLVQKAKFLAFSGLAKSKDGIVFERVQKTPILDRDDAGLFINAIHKVNIENDIFKIWYSAGTGWQTIHQNMYPKYYIRYAESDNGIHIKEESKQDMVFPTSNEYRIGRPRVYKNASGYDMYVTFDTLDKKYTSEILSSKDGKQWQRATHPFPLEKSKSGWDSNMIAYPSYIKTNYGAYIFYNGNNMGETGMGYAEVVND